MYSLIHVSSSEVSVRIFVIFVKTVKRSRTCDLQDLIFVLQYSFYILTFENQSGTFLPTSFAPEPHLGQKPTLTLTLLRSFLFKHLCT